MNKEKQNCQGCKYNNTGDERKWPGPPCYHPDYWTTLFDDVNDYSCYTVEEEK